MFGKAQGTIEYLVILGVIILIGLVVVGLSTNFLEQTEQINTTNNVIDSSIGTTGISITENVLDLDGDGAVTITNTNTQPITLTKITVNGVDNNYSKFLLFGDSATFMLNNLTCTCSAGETSKTCNYTFYFTQNGVTTTRTQTLTANCSGNFGGGRSVINPSNTCTSFSYSSWRDCNSDSLQARTVTSSLPTNCINGTPNLSQSCGLGVPCVAFGAGTEGDPIKLCDCTDLIMMDANTDMQSKFFSLGRDMNCYDDTHAGGALWNSGLGFDPIGDNTNKFTGGLDGNSHMIYDMYINRTTNYIGLFGYTSDATITDIGLIDNDMSGGYYFGGLIGYKEGGTTTGNYTTGSVTGSQDYTAGLIGYMTTGTVSDNYVTGSVDASGYTGGLIGLVNNDGTVSDNYVSGDITGANYSVGGLIGHFVAGTVNGNYVSGSTTGSGTTGGIIGVLENGTVTDNYTIGSVDGTDYTAGIIGDMFNGSATYNYSIGDVTGTNYVGGLIGQMANGDASYNYTINAVTADTYAGGLIGLGYGGTMSNNYWDITLTGQSSCNSTGDDGCTSTDNDASAYYGASGIPFVELSWSNSTWTSRDANHPILAWQ